MASYPPPPPDYRGPPVAYGYAPMRATNGMAIAALVCGLVAFAIPLLAIPAVILGPLAKREIAARPEVYDGAGMALAGQILGWVALALTAVLVAFFVVFFVALASTSSGYESLAALAA